MFDVMFGEIGKGMIMKVFDDWMVISEKNIEEKKYESEIWKILFGGS